jgi:hypothetical protein
MSNAKPHQKPDVASGPLILTFAKCAPEMGFRIPILAIRYPGKPPVTAR